MDFLIPGIGYSSRVVERYSHLLNIFCKNQQEARFWKRELVKYSLWYRGRTVLHGVPPPTEETKVTSSNDLRKNASMTWNRMFQQKKYLSDLNLRDDAFAGKVVCDIGAGPHANALCFSGCEIHGVDHLMEVYRNYGFPMDEYDRRYHFVKAKSEKTPFPDSFFDVVISVNAIDHVDDIESTSQEIHRILKPGGWIRVSTHYHRPTITEPVGLSDSRFRQLFGWAQGLHKIAASRSDYTWVDGNERKPNWNLVDQATLPNSKDEVFVVWGNF